MSLLRRQVTRPDVLAAQGRELIDRSARAHRARWGAGSADRCELDESAGVLRWTFRDRVVEAPVQVLGRCSGTGSARDWVWGWADDSVPAPLRSASDAVRQWGLDHGHEWLTAGTVHGITPERVADLAALGFVVTRATGFYRAPQPTGHFYLTFGPVTVLDRSGVPQPLTVDLEPSDRSLQRSWPGATVRRRGA